MSFYNIVNVFDATTKEMIESKEGSFKKSEKISFETGHLVTKKHRKHTVINVENIEVGGDKPIFISSPCSIEAEKILKETAMSTVTEILDIRDLDYMIDKTDILQGVIIESYKSPDSAWNDGKQSIYPNELKTIIDESLELRK